jgi:hypothetical protein
MARSVIGFKESQRIRSPPVGQTVSKEMANQRKRIGLLDTPGSVAVENAKVYRFCLKALSPAISHLTLQKPRRDVGREFHAKGDPPMQRWSQGSTTRVQFSPKIGRSSSDRKAPAEDLVPGRKCARAEASCQRKGDVLAGSIPQRSSTPNSAKRRSPGWGPTRASRHDALRGDECSVAANQKIVFWLAPPTGLGCCSKKAEAPAAMMTGASAIRTPQRENGAEPNQRRREVPC